MERSWFVMRQEEMVSDENRNREMPAKSKFGNFLFLFLFLGEFTLTLKKDGTDRIIKIFSTNGRYGFLKDAKSFGSVVELINHFRTNSLIEYNSVLDICLLYPVSKFSNEDELQSLCDNKEALAQKYSEVSNELKNLASGLEQSHENLKRVENEIGFKRQAHEGEHWSMIFLIIFCYKFLFIFSL